MHIIHRRRKRINGMATQGNVSVSHYVPVCYIHDGRDLMLRWKGASTVANSRTVVASKAAIAALHKAMEGGRTRIHVIPHDRGWAVRREGAARASSVHREKQDAVRRAKQIARERAGGQVMIHGINGRVQSVEPPEIGRPVADQGLHLVL